jgi:predicted TIM-barrel fold metal-dependent hydrolase
LDRLIISSAPGIVYDFREGNRQVAEAVEKHPELYAYVVVNANYLEESCREMDHYLGVGKFVGVKIHTSYQGRASDSAENLRLLEAVAKRGRPVLLHGSTQQESLRAVERFPELPIILAHAGNPWRESWQRVAEGGASLPNLFIEFAASTQFYSRIRGVVDIAGAEKVLFGSDTDLISPSFVHGAYEEAGLNEEESEKVFWANAVRLFSIKE